MELLREQAYYGTRVGRWRCRWHALRSRADIYRSRLASASPSCNQYNVAGSVASGGYCIRDFYSPAGELAPLT